MPVKIVFTALKYPGSTKILSSNEFNRDLEFDRELTNASNGWKYIPADAKLNGE